MQYELPASAADPRIIGLLKACEGIGKLLNQAEDARDDLLDERDRLIALITLARDLLITPCHDASFSRRAVPVIERLQGAVVAAQGEAS